MIIYTILLLFSLSFSCSYNILVVFPYPGKSHTILGEGYVRNLLKVGHEVTYITPILMKNTSEQLQQIDVSSNFKFAAVFNCPLIWSSSMDPHQQVLSLIDETPNPAYTTSHVSAVEAPFTFLQRVKGLWDMIHVKYLKWSYTDYENKIFQEAYGPAVSMRGRQLPSLQEVSYNASLILGNSHISTGQAVRLPQNYISIAGYHILEEDRKPLPKHIKKIMDDADHGVIYFSMGSMLKSSKFPEALNNGFLKMFGELNQTVIWKFEEEPPDAPMNVHLLKWAPQTSILEHLNCILFITHGGLLSITEAVKNGIPLIGLPIFGDQFVNIDRAVKKGFAEKVNLNYKSPENLKIAIENMVSNNRYQQKAKELSFVHHHRPMSPGSELVHWVEHVVRTRGAPHLLSPALHVPLYQKMYLDLAAVVLITLIVITKLIKRLFRKQSRKEKQKRC